MTLFKFYYRKASYFAMNVLHKLFSRFMRNLEEKMISRLIKQRDFEMGQVDTYRQAMKMKVGEF